MALSTSRYLPALLDRAAVIHSVTPNGVEHQFAKLDAIRAQR